MSYLRSQHKKDKTNKLADLVHLLLHILNMVKSACPRHGFQVCYYNLYPGLSSAFRDCGEPLVKSGSRWNLAHLRMEYPALSAVTGEMPVSTLIPQQSIEFVFSHTLAFQCFTKESC